MLLLFVIYTLFILSTKLLCDNSQGKQYRIYRRAGISQTSIIAVRRSSTASQGYRRVLEHHFVWKLVGLFRQHLPQMESRIQIVWSGTIAPSAQRTGLMNFCRCSVTTLKINNLANTLNKSDVRQDKVMPSHGLESLV